MVKIVLYRLSFVLFVFLVFLCGEKFCLFLHFFISLLSCRSFRLFVVELDTGVGGDVTFEDRVGEHVDHVSLDEPLQGTCAKAGIVPLFRQGIVAPLASTSV